MNASLEASPLLTPTVRRVVIGVAVVLGLNLLLVILDTVFRAPSGPPSSSFATSPAGVAAYAELLAREGKPLGEPIRDELADSEVLDASSATVVLLDPGSLDQESLDALEGFVDGGGRLIAGGVGVAGVADRLVPGAEWLPSGPSSAEVLAPLQETAGVTGVVGAGTGAWASTGGGVPLLGTEREVVALVAAAGEGRTILLADASPLQNEYLDQKDNAVFCVNIAGPPGGAPVHFVEVVHGYGTARGIWAVPFRWRVALGMLTLAALVWMASRAKRLGPPEILERELPPARKEFVTSVATTLAKARRRSEVIAPLRQEVRRLVVARAGLSEHASPSEVEKGAVDVGLDGAEVRALTGSGTSDDDLLAIGRALVKIRGGSFERSA